MIKKNINHSNAPLMNCRLKSQACRVSKWPFVLGVVLSRAMEMLGVSVTLSFLVLYDAQKAMKKKLQLLDMTKVIKLLNNSLIKN